MRLQTASLAFALLAAGPVWAMPAEEPPHTSAGQAVGKATDKVVEVGSDTWVMAKVKEKIMTDPLTKKGVIHVEVKDHVVTLTGSVPDQGTGIRAAELARETQGASQVVDRLAITPTP